MAQSVTDHDEPTCSFSWITDRLAIGGRFHSDAVPSLAYEHRFAAVIDLRSETSDDELALRAHGIALLCLPTRDRCGVALEMLATGVAFARGHLLAERRVLIHCEHGIGRSAVLALCVLVEGGLSPLAAMALAKQQREVVSPSPEQYESWAAWLRATGREPPCFEAFASIAYRHLRVE